MTDETAPDFAAILRMLDDHDVEFIVVGALSAVLQGAPIMTLDVDVVHRRNEANVDRLLEALAELDARYRGHPNRALRPDASRLCSAGHQLLITKWGPLDVLGAIEEGLQYDDLTDDVVEIWIDDRRIDVLTLRRYVELKEGSSREKDRARLATLRRTLERGEDDGET